MSVYAQIIRNLSNQPAKGSPNMIPISVIKNSKLNVIMKMIIILFSQ